jgi:lactoylglutathione lyase
MPPSPAIDIGVEQLVPLLMVKSMDRSLSFYVDGLGFSMTNNWMDQGKLRWCWLEHGGAALMLQELVSDGKHAPPLQGKVGLGVGLNFICRDALAFYRQVRHRGISAKRPFVGNRMWVTSLEDPDGYSLHFESPTDAPEESEYRD